MCQTQVKCEKNFFYDNIDSTDKKWGFFSGGLTWLDMTDIFLPSYLRIPENEPVIFSEKKLQKYLEIWNLMYIIV